jgi:sigma-B regulation protein RsbU (phosphoserine phosphatase)
MLRFSDFVHLPQVDGLVRQVVHESTGTILIAGLDNRPAFGGSTHFLPSGRTTIFRILVSELLDAHPRLHCVVVAEDREILHVARRFKRRLTQIAIKPPIDYREATQIAAGHSPALIVVDRIGPDNVGDILAAGRHANRVITQLDTIYHAQAVISYLATMGATAEDLRNIDWVLSIQRLPTLCPICKQPAQVTTDHLAQLHTLPHRFPEVDLSYTPAEGGVFYQPEGCPACRFTGRQGDVAIFDFFKPHPVALNPESGFRPLPMEAYVWMLAQGGQLALTDALNFEGDQLSRTYSLLMNTERQATEASFALERKSVELDTANRLLEQRTRELISLEAMGQALTTWHDLSELGGRVINSAIELAKADRAVLYYVRSYDWAQILASRGWPEAKVGYGLARNTVYLEISDRELGSYLAIPPGIDAPGDGPPLRTGLTVPLVAHGIPTGLMIIQSTRKTRFSPGEIAIMETLAGHAAVAMQRAGLIEQLQSKIDALEQAHQELAQKERLEHEMELARQVQLSMLPRQFPEVPGLLFAARYAPARHVGGDFYDVIRVSNGHLGLVIADVSDKGIPAALYMTLVRTLILANASQELSPQVVLNNVNHPLFDYFRHDMFVTVFYGVMDLQTRRLTYCRAGHDHPIIVRRNRVEFLGGEGMALGLFETGSFYLSEESAYLYPGDKLLLYTDGLSDAVNDKGDMLERRGLVSRILAHADKSLADFCTALFDDLTEFQQRAVQFDDMALLAVMIE